MKGYLQLPIIAVLAAFFAMQLAGCASKSEKEIVIEVPKTAEVPGAVEAPGTVEVPGTDSIEEKAHVGE